MPKKHISLYVPDGVTFPFDAKMVSTQKDLLKALEAGGALLIAEVGHPSRLCSTPHILMSMKDVRSSKSIQRASVEIRGFRGSHRQSWGLYIKLGFDIERGRLTLERQKFSAPQSATEIASLKRLAPVAKAALRAAFDAKYLRHFSSVMPTGIDPNEVARLIEAKLCKWHDEIIADQGRANHMLRAHRAALDLLPEGAPLVIRNAPTAKSWQLGLKSGRMTLALARNTRLASEEDVDLVIETGALSNHFKRRVIRVLDQINPTLKQRTQRFRPIGKMAWGFGLDKADPLHATAHQTSTKKKAPPARFWIQTEYKVNNQGRTLAHLHETGAHERVVIETDHDLDRVNAIMIKADAYMLPDFEDFSWVDDQLVVTQKVFDTLYEIDSVGIPYFAHAQRVEILDIHGKAIDHRWLIVPARGQTTRGKSSVLQGAECDTDLSHTLDGDGIPGADLWIERVGSRGRPHIAMSPRLHRALKKQKITLPPRTRAA